MTMDLLGAQRRVFTSDLKAPEKLVALALLDHWSRTGATFPSVARLARWTSLGRCAVMRAIAGLRERSAIVVHDVKGRPHLYDLTPLLDLPVSDEDQSSRETGLPERHHRSSCETPPVSQEDTKEPSKEPKKEPTAAREPGSPMEGTQKRKRNRQPETALPADWQPTEAHREYAAKHALDLQLEVDSFRGWADGRTTVSWNGTFTTRLANQAKWNRERGNGRRGKPVVQRGGTIRESDPSWLDGAAE